jgi:hypothetical protein
MKNITLEHDINMNMKNKPNPALEQTLYLSNEIKERIPKSRQTIPLMANYLINAPLLLLNMTVQLYFYS